MHTTSLHTHKNDDLFWDSSRISGLSGNRCECTISGKAQSIGIKFILAVWEKLTSANSDTYSSGKFSILSAAKTNVTTAASRRIDLLHDRSFCGGQQSHGPRLRVAMTTDRNVLRVPPSCEVSNHDSASTLWFTNVNTNARRRNVPSRSVWVHFPVKILSSLYSLVWFHSSYKDI
jgi:hypothetical protein